VLRQDLWRASDLSHRTAASVSSGFSPLDRQLPGGGWPTHDLTELLVEQAGSGALRLLMPVLLQATAAAGTVALFNPPALPYAPALAAWGIDLRHLLLVDAGNAHDGLWAVEQAFKSGSLAVTLAWLPEQGQHATLPLTTLRRLQLAAQSSPGLCFAVRPAAARRATSAAPLRLHLSPAAPDRLRMDIVKRRGPPQTAPLTLDLPPMLRTQPQLHRNAQPLMAQISRLSFVDG
jgi:protein ImuA